MLSHHEDLIATVWFFDRAIAEIAILSGRKNIKILDFGCGAGDLANEFSRLGYDAYGCDVFDSRAFSSWGHFRRINRDPYRIPFANNEFDIVTSTSVLEHAQNPDEYMPEISRVLRPGGCAMDLFARQMVFADGASYFRSACEFFLASLPRLVAFLMGCPWSEKFFSNWYELARCCGNERILLQDWSILCQQ
jgi:ubiquinone/menaquinone biosynthesis C-methylase UbiE